MYVLRHRSHRACNMYVRMNVFVCIFCCLLVVLPVASPPGEGTRQRPDGGARRQFYCCRPGVFFFHPSGFSFPCSSFVFPEVNRFTCFFALALSRFEYMLPFLLFAYLRVFFSFFIFHFLMCFLVFPFSLF